MDWRKLFFKTGKGRTVILVLMIYLSSGSLSMIEELERPSSSAAGNCIGKTEKYVRPLSISIRPASAAMLGLVRADEDDAVAIDYLSQYCLGKPALNVSFGLLCDHEAWYWKSNHTFDSTQ